MLAATILASSLAFVDGSVVNVALPAIGRALRADAAQLQWIINAYLLPLTALLLLGGAAGDRFGRRRLLLIGTTLFGLTSLACALAPAVSALLVARFLQGVSAALLMPNSLAILGASFSGAAKGRAVGVWAATGAALGAAGPVLGGWLVDLGSWRGIFLINLPLAAAAIALAARDVPPDLREPGPRLDLAGALWATAGLGALTWTLTSAAGRSGFGRADLISALAALAALVLFIRTERRCGERAMMPLALFAAPGFIGLTLFTVFLYAALGALSVVLPFVLIAAAHYPAAAAGAALLPLPLLLAAASPSFGALAGRIGARVPLTAGALAVAAGFVWMAALSAQAHYLTEVLPPLLLIALGLSAAVAPLTTAVLDAVDRAHTGAASGINNAVARGGGLVATALLGAVLAARGPALLAAYRIALWVCAGACALAAASSALLLPRARHEDR